MTATLADRLAIVRTERAVPVRRPAPAGREDELAQWFGARVLSVGGGRVVRVERSSALSPATAERLKRLPTTVYFDTETTGLSTGTGTVIFLAAAGQAVGERFVVRQVLLPDYPHEPALLRTLLEDLAGPERMVTYNGRGFDVPMLTARLTLHGLGRDLLRLPERHDDLLPIARRLWRRPLGGARLADIEAGVLGIGRHDDVPGFEIPGRWFTFLRGGSPDLLAAVLDHNAQDVVSLALIDAEIIRLREEGGWRDAPVLDARGMAAELVAHGQTADALELVSEVLAEGSDDHRFGLRRLAARLLVNVGEVTRAEELWRTATRAASVEAALAWIEVARLRERHGRDLRGALDAAQAASRVLDLSLALGRGGGMADIGRARILVEGRARRLRSWLAAAERRAAAVG